MKKILLILLFSLFSLGAQAIPMSWSETIDFSPDVYFGSSYYGGVDSYSYTHDIKNDGFVPGSALVTNYDLSIGLFDDSSSRWDRSEWAFIDLPGVASDGTFEIDYTDISRGISLLGLFSLNINGTLDVTINRVWGDFYLGDSTLNACGYTCGGGQSVAEPASFMVLILGVVLLVLRRRRV